MRCVFPSSYLNGLVAVSLGFVLLVIWFPFNNSRHTLSLLHQHLYVIHGYRGLKKCICSFSPHENGWTESESRLTESGLLFLVVTWERRQEQGAVTLPRMISHSPAIHKSGMFLHSSGNSTYNAQPLHSTCLFCVPCPLAKKAFMKNIA